VRRLTIRASSSTDHHATRRRVLVEEIGQARPALAEPDADGDEARTLQPLQAAAITHRIAFGPRAGRNVLTLRGAMAREPRRASRCALASTATGPHAAVRVEAKDRKRPEQLCR
jgi:hypothetical protein